MEEDRTTLVAAVGALTCQLPSTPSSQPVKRRTTSSSSTATRLTRNSLHKLRRINEDAAPAATASTFQSPTPRAFHVHDLNQRIKHLFPDPQVLALVSTTTFAARDQCVFMFYRYPSHVFLRRFLRPFLAALYFGSSLCLL